EPEAVRQQRQGTHRHRLPGAVQRGLHPRPGRPGRPACPGVLPAAAGRARLRRGTECLVIPPVALLAILAGAIAGAGLFLLMVTVRGLPPRPPGEPGRLRRSARAVGPARVAAAVVAGLVVLVATGWLVAGAGAALLVLSWRGMSGAAGERAAMARLEALATWTESLRDTIAGAVGLEQAIPASLRAAAPSLRE